MDLSEVRKRIDSLDLKLIDLLAQRQELVETAGLLKPRNDLNAVKDSDRVAQVIATRREQATQAGLSPDIAQVIWQAMIDAFIDWEININQSKSSPTKENL